MNLLASRSLAGSPEPTASIARDIGRIVVTAVVAGTAFALLLALTVLSLTVIAPPAQASGSPTVVTAVPANGTPEGAASLGAPEAPAVQIAAVTPAAPKPTVPVQVAEHERLYDTMRADSKSLGLYVGLAALAGLLGFFMFRRMRSGK
ncbi:MAG TPA: hypothetical protein VHB46_09705 [Burkholderiales bacterium]|nr:hypothetical protein [Burkholderiales bacterium]